MDKTKQYFDEECAKAERFVGESLNIDIKKNGGTILIDLDNQFDEPGVKNVLKDGIEHGKLVWKENVNKVVMWLSLFFAILCELYFIKQFALAFYGFDRTYIDNLLIYIPVILPVTYILTLIENFNYFDLKMVFYKLGLFATAIKLIGFFYFFVSEFTSAIVLFVNAFGAFPPERIVMLGYALNGLFIALAALLIYRIFEDGYEDVCNRFENFKLGKELGPEIKKYEYSAGFIKNIENKKLIKIPEKDRMLHLGIIGATGSGKTATVILPLVFEDLKRKFYNDNYVKKTALKMIKKGRFDIIEPFDDKNFSMAKIMAKEGDKKAHRIYNKLLKMRPCGITVVGPDDSLSDKVYDMAKLFGFNVNRLDPLPDDNGKYKEGYVGLNPLHVSETTPEWALERERIKRATLFADVMQFIYEMKGKSDPYFSSINRVGTTFISLLLMITMPEVDKRHPNPVDVQRLLNDFDKIGPYYKVLKKISKDNGDKYDIICSAIYKDFIEESGRKVFEQHSRGLKTQLNEFLTDTLITDLFTAEKIVDFDKILSDGDITVVNIELGQLGSVNAPALGLFVSMLMNNAVLSRPGNEQTRMPHFLYYDEFPVFASPALEGAFTLYRKFRVGLTIAMQTTDQMNKTPYLSYMKGVILNSCRSLVFFGGANVSDMELVNKMAGTVEDTMNQRTTSHSSLTVENPFINFSERITAVESDKVTASDVRYTDFKEVHYFYTIDGNPMPVVKGKLEFVKKSELRKRRVVKYNFNQFFSDNDNSALSTQGLEELDDKVLDTLQEELQQEDVKVGEKESSTEMEVTEKNDLGFDPNERILSSRNKDVIMVSIVSDKEPERKGDVIIMTTVESQENKGCEDEFIASADVENNNEGEEVDDSLALMGQAQFEEE